MSNNSPRGASDKSSMRQLEKFSALRWERENADQFLEWWKANGIELNLMETFAEAIVQTLHQDGYQFAESGALASNLKPVLTSCDQLTFDNSEEVLSYAGLHLLDRYGRVNQVLEHLLRIGRLPLRLAGVHALEVGAGPAPALYATRDFYSSLLSWSGRGDLAIGPLASFHTLDRGQAWDKFLHHLSENLMATRNGALEDGQLGFGRSIYDFIGFDVRELHHRSIAARAAQIAREFDDADESISDSTARQIAYKEGVPEPSAYDLIFLCNFLTQQRMTEQFKLELYRLAYSLTPGGLLVIIGGKGGSYLEIYSKVRAIAEDAKLRDISPAEAFLANAAPGALSLVAKHMRANVKFATENCPLKIASAVVESLPKDITDSNVRFQLPKFQVLAFVRQGPLRSKKPKRPR